MKFLSMLDPGEYKSIMTDVEKAVDASLARHGFRPGHSAASVVSNVVSDQTARERYMAQMLALSTLITLAKAHSAGIILTKARNQFDLAIAAVEREFRA